MLEVVQGKMSPNLMMVMSIMCIHTSSGPGRLARQSHHGLQSAPAQVTRLHRFPEKKRKRKLKHLTSTPIALFPDLGMKLHCCVASVTTSAKKGDKSETAKEKERAERGSLQRALKAFESAFLPPGTLEKGSWRPFGCRAA